MKRRPERIVSLLSSNTEMACLLGLEERLVGISHECDWPVTILDRPRLTRTRIDDRADSAAIHRQVQREFGEGRPLYEIDEKLLRELRPDLILTQAQCEVCAVDLGEVTAAVSRIPPAYRPEVLSFQPTCIEDVLDDLQRLGRATGVQGRAEAEIQKLRNRIERVAAMTNQVETGERPRVLTLEWMDPPMPGGCWTPQLVEMAGGRHVLNAPGAKTRSIDWAEIADTQAEVLIVCPCGFGIEQTMKEMPRLLRREEIRALPAHQKGRVIVADGVSLFNRPGPRLLDTLELLARIIHPGPARECGLPFPSGMHREVEVQATESTLR